MYISLQFIILEILLGLVFLVVLYFMLRDLLKKILRKELETIKEPIDILGNYLVGKAQMEAAEEALDDDTGQGQQQTGAQGKGPGQKRVTVEPSPEKVLLDPVDVADEFVALKNANRINAYNLRVQKIWELYKSKKINIKQYNEELVRLKKEFGIEMDDDGPQTDPAKEKITPVKKLRPQKAIEPSTAKEAAATDQKNSGEKPAEEKPAGKREDPGTDS